MVRGAKTATFPLHLHYSPSTPITPTPRPLPLTPHSSLLSLLLHAHRNRALHASTFRYLRPASPARPLWHPYMTGLPGPRLSHTVSGSFSRHPTDSMLPWALRFLLLRSSSPLGILRLCSHLVLTVASFQYCSRPRPQLRLGAWTSHLGIEFDIPACEPQFPTCSTSGERAPCNRLCL